VHRQRHAQLRPEPGAAGAMRRIGFTLSMLLVTAAAVLVTSAGADDKHTYNVEFDNAFGIVTGSEVRVAGVLAGTVKELDVNEAKRAVVTVEISGPLSTFHEDASCSAEPQSLIAEYFVDCQPGDPDTPDLPDDGLIPVQSEKYGDQTFTTVQNDLVQNTLREPFKERFALIFNEFGTALAGNPENLNDAIRRGAPALRSLRQVLEVLGRQNRTIRDLNVNSDRIIARLTQRRQDVVRFIQNANRTAQASAERRADVSRDFELLPGFLAELRPSLKALGELADEQTPLLTDLDAASGQLARLTVTLPAFNDASKPAIESLGKAAVPGRRALTAGADEIDALRQASKKSFTAADQIANLLVDIDDPKRNVETNTRAAEETGRPAPTGYTGFEGLLNYVYYQTLAVNQFDQIGHLLHFILFEFEVGPCGEFNAEPHVPAAGGGTTTSASNRDRCVSWLGPTQPDINDPLNLPPYDPSVCPQGSDDLALCNPAGPRLARNEQGGAQPEGGAPGETRGQAPEGGQGPGEPQDLPNVVPGAPGLPDVGQGLGGLLGLGNLGGNSQQGGGALGQGIGLGSGDDHTTDDLLNFLFGN
ncbi:MAG: MlaD family protein, partial [Actinomycetota bacterium]